jgi:hypothetical protein
VTGTVGIGESAGDGGAATDEVSGAMGVAGAAGGVGGSTGVAVGVVGGGNDGVVGGELSTWPVAAAEDCTSGGSGVVDVCAPARDVNER